MSLRTVGEVRRILLQVSEEHAHARAAAEGRRAAEALVDHAPERVDVRRRADILAADLLRGHVVERAERLAGPGEVGRLAVLGQAEVGHVGRLAVQQDVAGLDVAVDEAARVQRVDPFRGAGEHADRRRDVETPVGHEPVVQRPAGDQLLDQIGQAALFARPEHGDHVRVGDLLGRGDLALEAPHEHLVLRELGGNDLDRHGSAAFGDTLEDDAHAATADGPGNPVGTYGIARPGLDCDLRHTSGQSITAPPQVQSCAETSGQP